MLDRVASRCGQGPGQQVLLWLAAPKCVKDTNTITAPTCSETMPKFFGRPVQTFPVFQKGVATPDVFRSLVGGFRPRIETGTSWDVNPTPYQPIHRTNRIDRRIRPPTILDIRPQDSLYKHLAGALSEQFWGLALQGFGDLSRGRCCLNRELRSRFCARTV